MRTTARRAAAPPRPPGRFGRSGRAPQARSRLGGRKSQAQARGRFRGRGASANAQKRGGEGAGLERLAKLVPGLLPRSRGRSSGGGGPLGMLSRRTAGSGGRSGGGSRLPLNAKALAGLLGAGAAGTAMARKRRADRAAETPAPDQPPRAPVA